MPGMVQLQADDSPLSTRSTVSHSSLSPPLHSSSLSMSVLSNGSSQWNSPLLSQLPSDIKSENRGLCLIQLLLRCANSIVSGNMENTNLYLEQLSLLASLTGDPMQRVATYFTRGLATRITKSWPGLYKALNSTQLSSRPDLLSTRKVFFNLCPYLKWAYTAVNQSILDAMEGEKVVHLIDLGSYETIQWIALLQSFSNRPEGPPHLRITIINERKDILHRMGQRLSEEAEKLDIPFQFHPIVTRLVDLNAEILKVKTGEAVAVSSALQLHALLAENDRYSTQGELSSHGRSQAISAFGVPSRTTQGRDSGRKNLRSLQYKEERAISFPTYNMDERGIKRSRDAAFANNHRRTFNLTQPAVQEKNEDSILEELFDRERGESIVYQNGDGSDPLLIDLQRETYHNGRWARKSGEDSPSDFTCDTAADTILRMLRGLCPKIILVVEQDSNNNSPTLEDRFVEALQYYCALFDSLQSTLPEHSIDRMALEQHLFGQEIQNIVACEGSERVERHEKLERWKRRMEQAGFLPFSFSYSAIIQAKSILISYSCEGHRLVVSGNCLRVCWQDTPLFSASAWQI